VVDYAVAERQGALRKRMVAMARGSGFHQVLAEVVDLDQVEKLLDQLDRVLAGERVYVKVGVPPPVAVPGRGRGWRPRDEA
jgi:hypothetical protein